MVSFGAYIGIYPLPTAVWEEAPPLADLEFIVSEPAHINLSCFVENTFFTNAYAVIDQKNHCIP